MSALHIIKLDFNPYDHYYMEIRNDQFKIKEVSFKIHFTDWEKGMMSTTCDIAFFENLYEPQEKKIQWFLSNELSKTFRSNLYEKIYNNIHVCLKKEPSFIEEENRIKDLNDKFNNQESKYILFRSKVVGVHESVFVGEEWVERNSNRLGLDFYVKKYENYFTPYYHIINLEIKSNKPSFINEEGKEGLDTEGYDWIYPLPIEDTIKLFQELGIHIIKGNTIYTHQLEPVRLNTNSKEYRKVINTPFKKHRIFYHSEDVFIPSFKKCFVNDCVFNIS